MPSLDQALFLAVVGFGLGAALSAAGVRIRSPLYWITLIGVGLFCGLMVHL